MDLWGQPMKPLSASICQLYIGVYSPSTWLLREDGGQNVESACCRPSAQISKSPHVTFNRRAANSQTSNCFAPQYHTTSLPRSQAEKMSDREGGSGVPPLDDELSLPKATVQKMISGKRPAPFGSNAHDFTRLTCLFLDEFHGKLELLPADINCAKETRDLIIECCVGALYRPVRLASS